MLVVDTNSFDLSWEKVIRVGRIILSIVGNGTLVALVVPPPQPTGT